ncbi:MAG: acetyl-coenzyme A synthetase N-terminal domain-containing protein, partial [Desulfobacteraceae bacterium]
MADKPDLFGSHLSEFEQTAYVKGMAEYERLYRRSIEAPEIFWAEQAEKYLTWFKPWDRVLNYDFDEALIEWFGGGALNAAYNCIDRHLETSRDKVAYYWQGDDPADT